MRLQSTPCDWTKKLLAPKLLIAKNAKALTVFAILGR
jgi:hypothetical protein